MPEITQFLKDRFDPSELEIHFDKPYGIDLVDALHRGQVLPDFDKVLDNIKSDTANKKISVTLKKNADSAVFQVSGALKSQEDQIKGLLDTYVKELKEHTKQFESEEDLGKLKDYITLQLDKFYRENKANLVGQVLVQQGESFMIVTKTKNKEAKDNIASLIDELESKMSMK